MLSPPSTVIDADTAMGQRCCRLWIEHGTRCCPGLILLPSSDIDAASTGAPARGIMLLSQLDINAAFIGPTLVDQHYCRRLVRTWRSIFLMP